MQSCSTPRFDIRDQNLPVLQAIILHESHVTPRAIELLRNECRKATDWVSCLALMTEGIGSQRRVIDYFCASEKPADECKKIRLAVYKASMDELSDLPSVVPVYGSVTESMIYQAIADYAKTKMGLDVTSAKATRIYATRPLVLDIPREEALDAVLKMCEEDPEDQVKFRVYGNELGPCSMTYSASDRPLPLGYYDRRQAWLKKRHNATTESLANDSSLQLKSESAGPLNDKTVNAIKEELKYLNCSLSVLWDEQTRRNAKIVRYGGIKIHYITKDCRPIFQKLSSSDAAHYLRISMHTRMTYESYVKSFKPGEFVQSTRPKCSVMARICTSFAAAIGRQEGWQPGTCVCGPDRLDRFPDTAALYENVDITVNGIMACVPATAQQQVANHLIESVSEPSSVCTKY